MCTGGEVEGRGNRSGVKWVLGTSSRSSLLSDPGLEVNMWLLSHPWGGVGREWLCRVQQAGARGWVSLFLGVGGGQRTCRSH